MAWGLSNGQFSAGSFALKAKAAGYRWAALELDDYGNAARWPLFKVACETHDIKPGVWFTEGGNVYLTPQDAAFTIAELESEGDYQGILSCLVMAETIPPIPRAVVTNFTPIDPGNLGLDAARAKVKPLIDHGFKCLTEAYLGDNVNATPDRLHFRAFQLGWATSAPVFGRWNAPASAYTQWMKWPGSSDYLAENVL